MMLLRLSLLTVLLFASVVVLADEPIEPAVVLKLNGDITDPAAIDFEALPKIAGEHAVVCPVTDALQFQLHNYLIHHDGKYWCMFSHGPVVEDVPTQFISYATSDDAINNFEPLMLASGQWLMTRRDARFNVYMLAGGVKAIDDWQSFPVVKRLEVPKFSPDEQMLPAETRQRWLAVDLQRESEVGTARDVSFVVQRRLDVHKHDAAGDPVHQGDDIPVSARHRARRTPAHRLLAAEAANRSVEDPARGVDLLRTASRLVLMLVSRRAVFFQYKFS
jgi:hypothetical protein